MPTFKEFSDKYENLEFRKTILETLMIYLDTNFLTHSKEPLNCLLTNKRVKVPEAAIELVIVELTEQIEALSTELDALANTPVQLPEKPEEFVKKSKKSQKEVSNQGDAS